MKTHYHVRVKNAAAFLILLLVFVAGSFSQTPQYYNFNNGTSANSFPFNMAAGKAVNSLFLAGEFNQPSPVPAGQKITKIYFRTGTAGVRTFTSVFICMAQDVITTLTSGSFYSGTYDTVYNHTNVTDTSTVGGWMAFTLDHPFTYDITKSLIIFVGQCGYSGTGTTVYNSTLSNVRRVWSVGGCPFAPYASGDASMVNCGIDVVPAATVNRGLLLPTPGVNTNYVSVPHQSSMIGFNTITIEGWMKPGSFTLANTMLNHGGASFDYQLGVSTAGTTGVPFFRANATIVTATGVVINAGEWTHLAATYDGTICKFYKNGALVYSQTIALTLGSSTNEMRIGRGNSDPGSGYLEEIRLWSVARTQGQIDSNKCIKYPSGFFGGSTGLKALWHFDSTYTDSINGYNGTPMGTVGFDTFAFPHPLMTCTLTGIVSDPYSLPKQYSLSQNYPNPFNPRTEIQFSLPKGEFVEIVLYDILGKKVATLLSEPKQPGQYKLSVDGSKLASGVYLYKMVAGDFTDAKKMVLLK